MFNIDIDKKINLEKGLPLIKTYKFKEEKNIRLLPYLGKDGLFKGSFKILTVFQLRNKIVENENIGMKIPKGISDTFFYIDDNILKDAINNIIPKNKIIYLGWCKYIFFYALIDKEIELLKIKFKNFETTYLKIFKLIHDNKDPFDPMNGIGINIKPHKESENIKYNYINVDCDVIEIDPISYSDNFRDFLLKRKCDLSDIEKYEISNHPDSKFIYNALKEYKYLKKIKWKMRECRLEKILNNNSNNTNNSNSNNSRIK